MCDEVIRLFVIGENRQTHYTTHEPSQQYVLITTQNDYVILFFSETKEATKVSNTKRPLVGSSSSRASRVNIIVFVRLENATTTVVDKRRPGRTRVAEDA